jgi:hypothetical protein
MKHYITYLAFLLLPVITSAQDPPFIPPPPPGYENAINCFGAGAGDVDSWVVYFNDNSVSNSDCISDDWVVTYFNDDGSFWVDNSYNPNCESDPNIDCYTTINFGDLNGCPFTNNGGNTNPNDGGGSFNCLMAVACEGCPTVESWVHCLTYCSGCE